MGGRDVRSIFSCGHTRPILPFCPRISTLADERKRAKAHFTSESLFAENLHRISCQIFLPGLDLANSHFGWNTRRHRLCHKV